MPMTKMKAVLVVSVLGAALALHPVYAHGFGERTELPAPLGLFLIGAGAAVALSFAVIGLFVRGGTGGDGYWRHDLLQHGWFRVATATPLLSLPVKALSVFLLALVLVSGFIGVQTPSSNFAPTFVWIIWWVGMAYVVTLIGNVWAVINPWKILFGWAEYLHRKATGRNLPPKKAYPSSWGVWPAFALFLAFAWLQDAFPESPVPSRVAIVVTLYSILTLGGMAVFGKHQWLRHAEVFTVAFGLLAKFSPTEVRVKDPVLCGECDAGCLDRNGECVDCYECFEKAQSREVNLRPWAIGLARSHGVTNDVLAVVVLLLATVTFDGFSATPGWVEFQTFSATAFPWLTGNQTYNSLIIADTLGVLLFPLGFFLVYLAFTYFISGAIDKSRGAMELARVFAFSLIPIALAYNIAHFVNLLLIQGQLIIPLASDPFGYGWDLFGSGGYQLNLDIINAAVLWYLSIAVIVVGHILAVYLSHLAAARIFEDHGAATQSQYPMLTLMVMYTVVSLWIIAQPIVA